VKLVRTADGRETTKTLTLQEWQALLSPALEAGPCHLDVMADGHDWHARRTKAGKWLVSRGKPSLAMTPSVPVPHDRQKAQQLDSNDPRVRELFIETGLFARSGQLLGDSADKYRQVQHYLELLRPLPIWEPGSTVRVLDAGCGKAYLSLALVLWAEARGVIVELTGVDQSAEVIESVSGIAQRVGLERARFVPSTLLDYARDAERIDLLVSLHACDTATDEALAAGVRLGAKAIVLVPCCHHELVEQIESAAKTGALPAAATWRATLGHGLTRQRLADLVTDSLRAAALEALGYKTDLIDFVSPEITARNLMIRAEQRADGALPVALDAYRALADEWAVQPALEGLLGKRWVAN
jgi:SAM-dependent methyltransferase